MKIYMFLVSLQEHKRPTIDALLSHPSLVKRAKKAEQAGSSSASGSGDETAGSESRREALRRREEALALKEKLLIQKEKDLDSK